MPNTPEINSSPSNISSEWSELGKEVPFRGDAPKVQLPTSSPNHTCNFYLREIQRTGRAPAVEAFINSALQSEYQEFAPNHDFEEFATNYAEAVEDVLDSSDQAALKSYSGLGYKAINQVARGFWDYDTLGRQTPEKLEAARESIAQVSHAITSAPAIGVNFATFRGTNLDSFRDYGVNSVADLANLENQLFLDTGFCSTSFIADHSFAGRTFDDPLRKSCNITIKYLVPAGSHEGVGLLTDRLSYSPNQNEYLINRDNLSYISKVAISKDQSSAELEMALIPREIYDPASA